ncbi:MULTISPECIES: acyl-CoA dehydratase activase-related protein [unclassified Candidatus Frackibacter]|uniref:acyl-CoA dehydratase activase-related protein n=1 Tax=unclassified Candidatus Frackibacter TaxID=2648818 RepID=UPI00088ECFCF|nr:MULTISPECIES: acyl-CoA dehydratase activase-related protein [unclassified Candidatus Frackibacter]SDC11331.1 Predicted nucleotide-binding protein, sugar kinase/HSP70/actin superfamily [Candidatus Frackibacter sp. WG11]SEM36553.1 Predicted nucleotide-binding protein, sugar kinase/HSP70/actin superfamily [Candidatus Frackibacter sp. WG12]SFL41850.1 Predicted nucleotide-binding protein, sugar kinase/HSP70/actin superfamily [Candidatus Frackibacter sp. WG13]
MSVRIGIPKTLSYYVYYPLWEKFFTELGAEVVVSQNTSRRIVDDGVKETVNDACVPIKLFHGHVLNLKDKVDYIFIPRLVSVNGEQIYCPKFLGLPDMIKSTLRGLPEVIAPKIDLRKGRFELLKIVYQVGSILTKNLLQIYSAFKEAKSYFEDFNNLLKEGYTVEESLKLLEGEEVNVDLGQEESSLKVAVLGYPYITYDPYISVNMIQKLRGLGAEVVTTDMLTHRQLDKQKPKLKKDLFWTFSGEVVKAGYHYCETGEIDGLIHVTAFGCGPDFMVDKLLELAAKDKEDIAFMTLTIDEHTGEAGIVTRLEAFVDMLNLRRKH